HHHIESLRRTDEIHGGGVHMLLVRFDLGKLFSDLLKNLVPKNESVPLGVGLGDHCHLFARTGAGEVEAETKNALYALARVQRSLNRELFWFPDPETTTGIHILAFRIFADDDHVDIRLAFPREHRTDAGKKLRGPDAGILVEFLPEADERFERQV